MSSYKIDIEERKHFIKESDGCWIWLKYRDKRGYGHLRRFGKNWLAHRYMYLCTNGDFDRSLNILHKCDNPSCINPDHLFIGTQRDNILDCIEKKRYNRPKGEYNPNCKYSDIIVEEIRELYSTGLFTQKQLSKLFGISKSMVGYYVNNTYRKINKNN